MIVFLIAVVVTVILVSIVMMCFITSTFELAATTASTSIGKGGAALLAPASRSLEVIILGPSRLPLILPLLVPLNRLASTPISTTLAPLIITNLARFLGIHPALFDAGKAFLESRAVALVAIAIQSALLLTDLIAPIVRLTVYSVQVVNEPLDGIDVHPRI